MFKSLTLTTDRFDEPGLAAQQLRSKGSGAVVTFVGVVRGTEDGGTIAALEYECFREMAERQFALLFEQLEQRWPAVASVMVVHRLGVIPAGEVSLWVHVLAPHRHEAFQACEWLIDEMKKVVPIWKKPLKEIPD